jgi:hypothetical protein
MTRVIKVMPLRQTISNVRYRRDLDITWSSVNGPGAGLQRVIGDASDVG